jgi:hypothetical protein
VNPSETEIFWATADSTKRLDWATARRPKLVAMKTAARPETTAAIPNSPTAFQRGQSRSS